MKSPSIHEALLLRCLTCRNELPFRPQKPESLQCHCGVSYRMTDGVLDFNVREQRVFNTWSESTPTRSEAERIKSWLDAGLVTAADLEYVNTVVEPERLKAAQGQGISALQYAMSRTTGLVLDLCAGMGSLYRNPAFLARPPAGLTVVTDLSRFALTAVRKRLADTPAADRCAFLACDARQLPLADKTVSLAVSVAGFQNAESASAMLEETRRVLAPGARLFTLCVFVEDDSRSLRLAEHIGCGELATMQRMNEVLDRTGFGNILVDSLLNDRVHERGDLMPLSGDRSEIALVSAVRRDADGRGTA